MTRIDKVSPELSVTITLQRESDQEVASYISGELVAGFIEIIGESQVSSIIDVGLTLLGKEHVVLPHDQKKKPPIGETFNFLELHLDLAYDSSSEKVPFEFVLPQSTCISSSNICHRSGWNAQVSYTIKATVKAMHLHPAAEFTVQEIKHFNVCEIYTTPQHPLLNEDQLLIKDQRISVSVYLPSSCFSPGETIPIEMELVNEPNKEIRSISVQLNRMIIFHAKEGKGKIEETEIVGNVVQISAFHEAKKCIDYLIGQYLNPSVNGKLFSLIYLLDVQVEFVGIPNRIKLQFPLTITWKRAILSVNVELPINLNKSRDRSDLRNTSAGEFKLSPIAMQQNQNEGKGLIISSGLQNEHVFFGQANLYHVDVPKNKNDETLILSLKSKQDIIVVGQYGSPPGLFKHECKSIQTSPGCYQLILGRYTTPRINSGRWYFSVAGIQFMQMCFYSIIAEMHSEGEWKRRQASEPEVREIIIERQSRLTPFSRWSFSTWTDSFGTGKPCKEDIPLPDISWKWKDAWEIDMTKSENQECDKDGWSYSITGHEWTISPNIGLQRKRKWSRTRILKERDEKMFEIKGNDEKAEEMEDLLGEFDILEVSQKKVPAAINEPSESDTLHDNEDYGPVEELKLENLEGLDLHSSGDFRVTKSNPDLTSQNVACAEENSATVKTEDNSKVDDDLNTCKETDSLGSNKHFIGEESEEQKRQRLEQLQLQFIQQHAALISEADIENSDEEIQTEVKSEAKSPLVNSRIQEVEAKWNECTKIMEQEEQEKLELLQKEHQAKQKERDMERIEREILYKKEEEIMKKRLEEDQRRFLSLLGNMENLGIEVNEDAINTPIVVPVSQTVKSPPAIAGDNSKSGSLSSVAPTPSISQTDAGEKVLKNDAAQNISTPAPQLTEISGEIDCNIAEETEAAGNDIDELFEEVSDDETD